MRQSSIAAAAALLLTAAPALAAWSDRQVEEAGAVMAEHGYSAISEPIGGSLGDDGTATENLFLPGDGSDTVVIGLCDNDCSDVDLVVYGPDGAELGSDAKTDDFPMVRFTARKGGTYRIKVTMATCSAEPCGYAVVAYQ